MHRSRLGFAALVVTACILPSAAVSASSPPPAVVAYQLTFTGSGNATSDYPPVATDTTVFTTTIDWKLIYDVTIDFPIGAPGSPWRPAPGSALEGSSTGIASAGGIPIEQGCDHIGLSLDDSQPGAAYAARSGRIVSINLATPGFQSGALLKYSPGQCANPFPLANGGPGCPNVNAVDSPTVSLDTTRASQSWTFTEQCDIPDQGQTAHWSGAVTATRRALPVQFSGHTAQRCARSDNTCAPGTALPVNFELFKGVVSHFVAHDEETCNLGETGHATLTPPSARLDAHGRFHVVYKSYAGAYRQEVSGTVTGAKASGTLSTTARFSTSTRRLDPHGAIRCHSATVHWTATGAS